MEDYIEKRVAFAERRVQSMMPRMRRVLESWRNACLLRVFDAWKQFYLVTRVERVQAAAAAKRAQGCVRACAVRVVTAVTATAVLAWAGARARVQCGR